MAFKAWHIPVRLVTGAFILNSGLSKRNGDAEAAQGLHGFATAGYPEFKEMPPEKFIKMLSSGEITVGALLLIPFVPALMAGMALMTFAGMLSRLYLKVPGMREEGSLRPTDQGVPLAKDFWMLGIGTALVIDGLSDRRRKRKAAAKANTAD